jgi:hypothetical protein
MLYVHIPLTLQARLRMQVVHNQGCTNTKTLAELTEKLQMVGKPICAFSGIVEI